MVPNQKYIMPLNEVKVILTFCRKKDFFRQFLLLQFAADVTLTNFHLEHFLDFIVGSDAYQ